MRLSLLQYTAEASVSESEQRLYPLLEQAILDRPDVIVLPECALFLSTRQAASREAALAMDSDPVMRLAEFARAHQVWIIVGSLIIQRGDAIVNRTLVFDRAGQLQATYDKLHLFDVQLASGERYKESALFAAGDAPTQIEIEGCQVGLSICFDLRFPKLYRHYAASGASLMLVPAAFTRTTGAAHWHTLLRARAIENGCFVAAAAQCGDTFEGRQTYGHSLIFDPWGDCLGELPDTPGVLTQTLDLSAVNRARAQIPVIPQDRNF